MKYIAPRKMTVASTCGRSVEFQKGVPTYAPPQMHADLIAVGVVPEEDIDEPEVKGPVEPTVPHEREAAVFKAFEAVILRNEREDFTANGSPHGKVLAKELGWKLDNKERDPLWAKFQLAKAEAA